jgi:hypothetical protein
MFKKATRKFCPLVKAECKGSDCMFAVTLRGTNPNTGAEVDEEGCAISWMPVLMVESNKLTNGVGAAVESARNEAVKSSKEIAAAALAAGGVINTKRIR